MYVKFILVQSEKSRLHKNLMTYSIFGLCFEIRIYRRPCRNNNNNNINCIKIMMFFYDLTSRLSMYFVGMYWLIVFFGSCFEIRIYRMPCREIFVMFYDLTSVLSMYFVGVYSDECVQIWIEINVCNYTFSETHFYLK